MNIYANGRINTFGIIQPDHLLRIHDGKYFKTFDFRVLETVRGTKRKQYHVLHPIALL